jgi:ethanolamine ammonia-lyase small subunit
MRGDPDRRASRAFGRRQHGAYLTFRPHPGTTDADRNCISNIRPEGLSYADAAFKIVHMLGAMRAARLSGVRLKDDSGRLIEGGRT